MLTYSYMGRMHGRAAIRSTDFWSCFRHAPNFAQCCMHSRSNSDDMGDRPKIVSGVFVWNSIYLPLPENAQYGAMLLTRLPLIRATRSPYPNTAQQRDFVEAEIWAPWCGNVIASTAHFESPTGCDLDNSRSGQLQHVMTWFGGAEPRGFDACMNWADQDGRMGDISPLSSGVSDLWKNRHPTKPGYTYNGDLNMNAKPGLQGRVGRILRSQYMTKLSHAIAL